MITEREQGWVLGQALIVTAVALMSIGLVMIASAASTMDVTPFGPEGLRSPLARQLVFAVVGVFLMFISAKIAPRLLESQNARRNITVLFFLVVLVLLVAALVPGIGDPHRGSNRWIRLASGGINLSFQPSEPAKFVLVAALAFLLGDRGINPRSFLKGFLPAAAAIGLYVGLIGSENLGTAALLACVGGLTLAIAGCRKRYLVLIALLAAAGLYYLLVNEPYRMRRITGFLNYENDPQGTGYQPLQSLVTIASGGWTGVGLGAGVQKYGYLPESHTDFIFSLLCEEAGMVGAGLVLILFGIFVWIGLRIVWLAPTRFERLLAFGFTAVIGIQAVINIAVVTVSIPTTGIALPLVSAGGSGLLALCIAIGILGAIAKRGRAPGQASLIPQSPAQRFAKGTMAWSP